MHFGTQQFGWHNSMNYVLLICMVKYFKLLHEPFWQKGQQGEASGKVRPRLQQLFERKRKKAEALGEEQEAPMLKRRTPNALKRCVDDGEDSDFK